MSEGYTKRPEETRPFDRLWAAFLCVLCCAFGGLISCALLIYDCGRVCTELQKMTRLVRELRRENATLQARVEWYTCQTQYEPAPIPEPVDGVGPTLIDDDGIIPEIEQDEAVPVPGVVGAAPNARSGKWPAVRSKYVKEHPSCEACGSTKALNVHHCQPFHEHPELELDPANLITLCRDCHFKIGHDPDGSGPLKPNWKASNPNVRRDAARSLKKTTVAP